MQAFELPCVGLVFEAIFDSKYFFRLVMFCLSLIMKNACKRRI